LSPDLLNDLAEQKINYFGELDLTERTWHRTCYHETNHWKPGDIHSRTRADLER
jgi:hypothetical protein